MDEWLCSSVRCATKNEHQKGTCLKEIGPHAQNMLFILSSIVNIIGEGVGAI